MEDLSAKNKTHDSPFLSVCEFGYRSQITFTGVGQRHFPVCSKKEKGLFPPWKKYFEISTHHYAWSNKEFEELQTSFASNKTSYFIRLFRTLTSEVGIFRQKMLCCILEVSCSILNPIVLLPSDLALRTERKRC